MALASLVLGGCLHSPVEEEWGEAYEETLESQVAQPADAPTGEAPEGVDGVTAEAISERYYEGQSNQPTRKGPALILEQVR
jgi:hypothetical protein